LEPAVLSAAGFLVFAKDRKKEKELKRFGIISRSREEN